MTVVKSEDPQSLQPKTLSRMRKLQKQKKKRLIGKRRNRLNFIEIEEKNFNILLKLDQDLQKSTQKNKYFWHMSEKKFQN